MACILPFKESELNSKQFLMDVGAVREDSTIEDEVIFDEVVAQLSTDASLAYNLDNETLWFKNPIQGGPVVPNKEQFERIDNRRKKYGVYDDKIAAKIPSVSQEKEYTLTLITKEQYYKAVEKSYNESNGMIGEFTEDGENYFVDVNDTTRYKRNVRGYFKEKYILKEKEYNNQIILPSDPSLKARLFKGKSEILVDEFLENVVYGDDAPRFVKSLARELKMLKILGNSTIHLIDGAKEDTAAFLYPPTNDIYVYTKSNFRGVLADYSILHEIIHSYTFQQLKHNSEGRQKLEQLFIKAKREILNKYPDSDFYGLINADEFLAEGLTNPEFIRVLSEIHIDQKETILQSFVHFVLLILGVDNKRFKNLFSELYQTFLDISNISNQDVESVVNNGLRLKQGELGENFFQLSTEKPYNVTPELRDALEQFVKKLNPNFKIEVLDDLLERRGVNGLAEIKNWTIQLQKGKEGALPEEVAHFFTRLLDDKSDLKKTMLEEITRTRMYKMVRNDPGYAKEYGNDTDMLKHEAMGKLIALYLTDKELFKHYVGSDELIDRVIRWIKDFFRWIRGNVTSVGSFIDSAESILNLDISKINVEKFDRYETMYSLAEVAKEGSVLKTVGPKKLKGLRTELYDKLYINLSDTIFDISSYDFGSSKEKVGTFMDSEKKAEREKFYKTVPLTSLGQELKDKVLAGFIPADKVVFYTSMYTDPALIQRLNEEFGISNVKRVNIESVIEDDKGRIVGTKIINKTEDVLKEETRPFVVIDNKRPKYDDKQFQSSINFFLYNDRQTEGYETMASRIKRKEQSEKNIKRINDLVDELKTIIDNREPVVKKIMESFAILRGEEKGISNLEERLKKAGISEEEIQSIFKNEYGDLLLPVNKAKQIRRLIEEIDKLEEGLIEFVGVIEALTAFFKERNDTNFHTIREQIESGDPKNLTNAIQELAQITRMGTHWQEYIQTIREYIGERKTDTVQQLFGDLDTQINRTKNLAKELSKKAIGNKLSNEFALYNANTESQIDHFKEKLQQTEDPQERQKIEERIAQLKKTLKGPENILSILNGEVDDIDPLTIWVKTIQNVGDDLIGSIGKLLQRIVAEVEVESVTESQVLGDEVNKLQNEYGVTEQDIVNNLTTIGHTWLYEGEGEDKKLVRKERLELLGKYKDLDKRFEMMQPYLKALTEWKEAKENKLPNTDELKKEYLRLKKEFNIWENKYWYKEYTEEFYNAYDEFKQTPEDELMFEEALLAQSRLYSQREDLVRQSQYIDDFQSLKLINEQIEDIGTQLKHLKKEVNFDGTPKSEYDVKIAKILQRKTKIDGDLYEYEPDSNRFRGDFIKFINSIPMDSVIRANLVKFAGEDTYGSLYEYAKLNAPYQVIQWLDLNTVIRIDPLWYQERKVIIDQIINVSNRLHELNGVDVRTDIGEKWDEIFSLTSDLRDEDNIFDGTQATPEIQTKVKELEEEIETLKELAKTGFSDNPEVKELKEQLTELIKELNKIQSKSVTNAYIDEFIDLATSTGFADDLESTYSAIAINTNTDPLEVINTLEFNQFIEDNPDHPFSIWFKNNHIDKSYFNGIGERVSSITPTYIWHKIEPTDSKRIHTVPTFKYSTRKVKEKYVTKKTPETYHPVIGWLPKSPEFLNEKWMALHKSTNRKDIGLTKILKLITDFHLSTQENTGVREGKLGFGLPYIHLQMFEGGVKESLYQFFDVRNRFEKGEGNYEESEDGETKPLSVKDRFKSLLNTAVDWLEGNKKETTRSKVARVAVPYTQYIDPQQVTKDVLLSVVMFRAGVNKADRMMKNLSLFNIIEDVLENPPKVDSKGRIKDSNSNRIAALRFAREHWIYGVNKKYELGKDTGKTIDAILRFIRKVNTIGSLGLPAGGLNVIKNNLQGRFQNIIGTRFANWSDSKSMRKASANFNINFFKYLAEAEKPLDKRGIDFHIISFFNPTLDWNIQNNLLKGAFKRVGRESHIMLFNNAMEYSIAVNTLYGHLYYVKVKDESGNIKSLYDILEIRDNKLQVKPGYTELRTGKEITNEYLLETKLAQKTVQEYVQGRISDKTVLSMTTIGQSILYFKNWLIPMLRRRFDAKRPNYMVGEVVEGYWRTFFRMSIIMLRDMVSDGKAYWNTYTEEEKRNYITTLQEIAFMALSLALLSLVLGFNADDPDKFKKLKQASYIKKLGVLLAVQAKNETEALSAMPFLNVEKSAVPPILTEGSKWLTNPTIGLSLIDNTWKTINYTYSLVLNEDGAYYDKDMPQFNIEKGDTKAGHYFKKLIQLDDLFNEINPDSKLRVVIGMMKR